tara:strand:- start:56 stop:325 length:270 start_codon:yes stop_codon:yes gene_type:complete
MYVSKKDLVNNPKHYTQGTVECKDAMISAFGQENYKVFCKLNAFKYLWRSDHKDNPTQDIEKALWYMSQLGLKQQGKPDYPRRGNAYDE